MIDYNSCSFGSSDSNNAGRRNNVALIASHRIKKINQSSTLSLSAPLLDNYIQRTANCRVEKWNKFRELLGVAINLGRSVNVETGGGDLSFRATISFPRLLITFIVFFPRSFRSAANETSAVQ